MKNKVKVRKASDQPILSAHGLVKKYGKVTALNQCDFDLYPGEILAIIGDNGAGKSVLIKSLTGAVIPDSGSMELNGKKLEFSSPKEAHSLGIEAVYQNLAVAPALDITSNLFLGREILKKGFLGKIFRMLDLKKMQEIAEKKLRELGLLTISNMNQAVETLSGGQRQGVAVARATVFGSKVIIMDEPTAALGVKESRRVLDLILDIRKKGIPVVLISHNMPHVFEVADYIHIHRLGKRVAVIRRDQITMPDAVSIMTGALDPKKYLSKNKSKKESAKKPIRLDISVNLHAGLGLCKNFYASFDIDIFSHSRNRKKTRKIIHKIIHKFGYTCKSTCRIRIMQKFLRFF